MLTNSTITFFSASDSEDGLSTQANAGDPTSTTEMREDWVEKELRFLTLVRSRRESRVETPRKRYSIDLEDKAGGSKIQNQPSKSKDLFDQIRHMRTSRF